MVEFLELRGIEGATVLEVGGGVGEIQLELLKRGAARAVNLELSPAYEEEATSLLRAAGLEERAERRLHDIAVDPEGVEAADVVVLHRVVCCYPDYERLLRAAAEHTRRLLVFSYPPRNAVSRLLIAAQNLVFRLLRREFRTLPIRRPRCLLFLRSAGCDGRSRITRSCGRWRASSARRGRALAAAPQFPPLRAKRSATDLTAAETANSTAPCTRSCSHAANTTGTRSPTSAAAQAKARLRARRSAASSATSPATSSAGSRRCDSPLHTHRSITFEAAAGSAAPSRSDAVVANPGCCMSRPDFRCRWLGAAGGRSRKRPRGDEVLVTSSRWPCMFAARGSDRSSIYASRRCSFQAGIRCCLCVGDRRCASRRRSRAGGGARLEPERP